MKMRWSRVPVLFLIMVLTATSGSALARSLENQGSVGVPPRAGTAFTYQGQLKNASGPITASCDFRFSLWNGSTSGTQIGGSQTRNGVALTGGLFTIPDLDFGSGAFNGEARWLQIAVKCPGDADYISMNQRQALTPVPYAQFAATIYRRTLVVSPVGTATENGTALLNALASITDASATNPYLIHIEPGVYDLGIARLEMKSYVDMEGSGQDVTTISAAGTPDTGDDLWPMSTLLGADNAELRFLTVRNTGGNQNAVAIYNRGTSPRLTHITVIAQNGTEETLGIFNNGGAAAMMDMTINVYSGGAGVFFFMGSESTLTNVAITVTGGSSSKGIMINFSSPVIRNSLITSEGWGVEVNDVALDDPDDVVKIDNSQIHSVGSTFAVSQPTWPGTLTVRIGASQLAGMNITNPSPSKITFVCAGVYDENYVFSAGPACP